MRKNGIFLLHILLIATCVSAAAQTSVSELIATDTVVVVPASTHGVLKKLPFKDLVVWDRRFDTTKLGYVKKGGHYKKIATQQPFAQTIQRHLQQQYGGAFDATSPYTLVLVIKNLWLQETSQAEVQHHKIERSSETTIEFSRNTITCEVYATAHDAFIPLFRSDSSYTEKSNLKHSTGRLLIRPFEDCLTRTAGIGISQLNTAKRKLTLTEVEAYNNERLQHPRFTNNLMEKGIYKTFQDFLNNKITKQDFYIEFGPHTDEVFLMESKNPVSFTDFWGLCDGRKLYIRIGYGVFELACQNNAYDVWGSKMSVHNYFRSGPATPDAAGLILFALSNKNKVVTENKPLQLNMETGEVY